MHAQGSALRLTAYRPPASKSEKPYSSVAMMGSTRAMLKYLSGAKHARTRMKSQGISAKLVLLSGVVAELTRVEKVEDIQQPELRRGSLQKFPLA